MRIGAALALTMLSTMTVSAAAPGAPAATQAMTTAFAPALGDADHSPQPVAVAPAPQPQTAPIFPQPPAMPASLDPGEFVWQPERATSGPVEIVVSIPLQMAYIYRGETLIGVTTVSTGRRGHETPTGRFPIMEKRREHYSNLYNNAPMPFMQRLTWGGVALHAGHIPGHPASHGCVRLPLEFARLLFTATRVGTNVHIVDSSPTAEIALAVARGELGRGRVTTLAMNSDVRGTLSVR